MTRKEAIQVLAILKAAYPNSYKGMSRDEANGTVNVWATQFAKYPPMLVMIAVNKLISTNTFPPSICEVKEKIRGMYYEAWSKLREYRSYEEEAKVLERFKERRSELPEFVKELETEPVREVPAEKVAMLEQIINFIEPLRIQQDIEPSLDELLDSYGGYLNSGDDLKQLEG